MRIIKAYLKAFGRPFTVDVRSNVYLWFGLLWGLPIPVFSIFLDLSLTGAAGRTPLDAIHQHPVHYVFLAHPLLFALVFGAMGTIRHELEAENARLIDDLKALATTDALTGVPNRRYVLGEIQKAAHRAERSTHPFSVILFDLDKFKQVNDQKGHAAGDEVLRLAAGALAGAIRQGDVLGRYGGDEFLLLAYGGISEAQPLAERAGRAVQERTGLTASAGVSCFPGDGQTPEALIAAADGRLARIKRARYERDTTRR